MIQKPYYKPKRKPGRPKLFEENLEVTTIKLTDQQKAQLDMLRSRGKFNLSEEVREFINTRFMGYSNPTAYFYNSQVTLYRLLGVIGKMMNNGHNIKLTPAEKREMDETLKQTRFTIDQLNNIKDFDPHFDPAMDADFTIVVIQEDPDKPLEFRLVPTGVEIEKKEKKPLKKEQRHQQTNQGVRKSK